MSEINQQQDVKEEVRVALNSGFDIYHQIKTITLKALTRRQLDMENIDSVANAGVHGLKEGIATQG